MKVNSSKWIIGLSLFSVLLGACSSNAPTVTPTRVATQTPWIIYVPVTTTPEPAVATPLPTVGAPVAVQPTLRPTATRAPVVAVKPSATKPPAAPPAPVVVKPTAAPACNLGTVQPTFPSNPTDRGPYPKQGTGGAAFILKWDPPASLGMTANDPAVGYKVELTARRPGTSAIINATTVYIAHNQYVEKREFVFDARSVRALTVNDDAVVNWQVTIIKAAGFDNQGAISGSEISCGAPSIPYSIIAKFSDN